MVCVTFNSGFILIYCTGYYIRGHENLLQIVSESVVSYKTVFYSNKNKAHDIHVNSVSNTVTQGREMTDFELYNK